MAYATLALLVAKVGEQMLIDLTDRGDEPTGEIVESAIEQELANADALIDGFLAGRYALPLAEVPALLPPLAVAITIYKLHVHSMPDKVEADYKDAIATLDKIAAGKIRLAVAGVEPDSSGAAGVQTVDRERPFTEDNMKGFI